MRRALLPAAALLALGLGHARAEDTLTADIDFTAIAQQIASGADPIVPAGGEEAATSASGRASLSFDFGEGLSAVVTAIAWEGDGFDRANDLISLVPVNGDIAVEADDALTEAYVTVKPEGGDFGLSVGIADVSRLFAQSRLTGEPRTQFLNHSFQSLPAVEYPGAEIVPGAPGGTRLPYAEAVWLTIQPRGDPYSLTAGGARRADADENYYFAELRARTAADLSLSVFGWQADGAHPLWLGGPPLDETTGYGVSVDFVPRGDLALFFRAAVAEPEVSLYEQSWSAGIQMHGTPWGRPADVVGIGYARNEISAECATVAAPPWDAEGESVLEAYYRIVLRTPDATGGRPGVEITPGVQQVSRTGGAAGDVTATVAGLRLRAVVLF